MVMLSAMKQPLTLAELQANATTALRAYNRADGEDRTKHLKATARAFIYAREFFYTKEGKADWLGRTFAYRTWVREVMADANVDPALVTSVQSSIRYHTGNILRDYLDADTLDELGLRQESPRERSIEKRERTSETLALFAGGGPIDDLDDMRSALVSIEATLRRFDLSVVQSAPKDVRKALREAADAVCELAEAVAEAGGRRAS